MRGKDLGFLEDIHALRITPAYAGKRSQIIEDRYPVKGSPPPMRGKVAA